MARQYRQAQRKQELLRAKQNKWIRGLNTLVSNTQIRPDELAEATNIMLVEDGKIQCPRDGQAYYGTESGDRVTGLFAYYSSHGARELLRICEANLQKYNTSTSGWDNISGKTYALTSLSPSTSPSVSTSPSASTSPSVSLSPSKSPSTSPSVSTSPSPSVSLSPSFSPSTSPSVSLSPSVSPSTSPSSSLSKSVSVSPSKSPSLSPSVSPSLADSLNTNGVMAYDRLYLVNKADPLTYYDGSVVQTFTAISAPTLPTCTRTGGSTGSYTFSYKISAVTAQGETDPTSAASATLNQATLSDSIYMTVGWTASANAIGYNIYGRTNGYWKFLKYVEGQATNSWRDDGTVTESEVFTPPEGNSTGGPVGGYIALYKDSLFILGDPDNPSRLYYSGGGDRINDFSVSNGGGFIDINKNDGQQGTGLIVFKNTLICFKEDSIYQFQFTTSGLPQITQINAAVGCIAPRSIVAVENDVFFASRRGIFSIGNEPGFAFDVLRTNEISARVRSIFQSIETEYLDRVSAVYATKANVNLVIFAYTPSGGTWNSEALVYDRERLAWYKWTNIRANCWLNYIESDGTVRVLYGDDYSGYVKEILTGTNDFGTAIQGTFKLKAENFGEGLVRYKKLKDVSVVLREPVGSVTMTIYRDGVETATTMNIATVSPTINFGHYLVARFLLGVSYGTGAITSSDDIVLRTKKNLNLQEAKAFQLQFTNGSSGAYFTLLETQMIAKPKGLRYAKTSDIVSS